MGLDEIQAFATILGLPFMMFTWWDTRKARLDNAEVRVTKSRLKQSRECLEISLVKEIFIHKLKVFFSIVYIIITCISVIALMIYRDGTNYNAETGLEFLRIIGYYIFVGFSCLYFWVWISVNWGKFNSKERSQTSLAWESGEIARYENLDSQSNPYKPDSPLSLLWLEGWNSVHEETFIKDD